MSRSVFLSVVGIVTILSFVDTVDAQRFRNRNNDCGCQPNSQSYQPNSQSYRANFRQRYQPNYQALAVRRNYVAAQRVPMGYYQQNAMSNYRNVQNPSLRYQAVLPSQMRPAVQYSVARRMLGCQRKILTGKRRYKTGCCRWCSYPLARRILLLSAKSRRSWRSSQPKFSRQLSKRPWKNLCR